ncbi:MAG: ATP synthase F1 subunit delta [Lachnospiraceae bacterium]|nr:ATP synthase F1 subunit delta [Lachnospiraceae bacterium]
MAAGVVSGTYGHALFELAVEQNEIDSLMGEAEIVEEVLRECPEFTNLLDHPRIGVEQKTALVEEAFGGRVSSNMTGFLIILVKNDRQREIRSSLAEFIAEVKEYRRIGVCRVVSALPLSDDQKKRLTDRLIETTSYRVFEMDYRVDPKLIGGMTIQIGDRVLDSSIRSKLNGLKKTLQAVSVE